MRPEHPPLPRTPAELFRLAPWESALYRILIGAARMTGRWSYPARRSGDLETMTLLDKAYWLHKVTRPIERGWRGADLERYFADRGEEAGLPAGFEPISTARISAAGDLTNHPYLSSSRGALYAASAGTLFDGDVAMANLECVALPETGAGDLRYSPRAGPALALDGKQLDVLLGDGRGGRRFDLVATACNHSLDFGEVGVASTVAALEERGVAFDGIVPAGRDPWRPTILVRNGIRIGVFAATFGLNGRRAPEGRPGLIRRLDLNAQPDGLDWAPVARLVEASQADGVDFLVAQLHWGYEHELYPRPEQIGLAHRMAEMGVDLVVGHHPHVVQPMERYRTARDRDRIVPIYYSLGNLVNPFSAPYLCRGGVAQVEIVKGRLPGGTVTTLVGSAEQAIVEQVVDAPSQTVRIVPRTGRV